MSNVALVVLERVPAIRTAELSRVEYQMNSDLLWTVRPIRSPNYKMLTGLVRTKNAVVFIHHGTGLSPSSGDCTLSQSNPSGQGRDSTNCEPVRGLTGIEITQIKGRPTPFESLDAPGSPPQELLA
jgi:hypothetical protein